jgi:hypothetical protein
MIGRSTCIVHGKSGRIHIIFIGNVAIDKV